MRRGSPGRSTRSTLCAPAWSFAGRKRRRVNHEQPFELTAWAKRTTSETDAWGTTPRDRTSYFGTQAWGHYTLGLFHFRAGHIGRRRRQAARDCRARARNVPHRRDPERFHTEKSCIVQDLEALAGVFEDRAIKPAKLEVNRTRRPFSPPSTSGATVVVWSYRASARHSSWGDAELWDQRTSKKQRCARICNVDGRLHIARKPRRPATSMSLSSCRSKQVSALRRGC